ncbi:hypothetical protein AWV80_05745 [Cupriavidus sp. UYMU48A]|nr:hypothetical protein AWV80_05745 [Cupriavidus sp. UYMU48A]
MQQDDADDSAGQRAGNAYDMVQPATFVAALGSCRETSGGAQLAILVIRLDRFASACESVGPRRAARLRQLVQARLARLMLPAARMYWLGPADLAVVTPLAAATQTPCGLDSAWPTNWPVPSRWTASNCSCPAASAYPWTTPTSPRSAACSRPLTPCSGRSSRSGHVGGLEGEKEGVYIATAQLEAWRFLL